MSNNPFNNNENMFSVEDTEDGIFHVESLEWHPSKEQGKLTSLASGSNVLLVATKNNFLIRLCQV